MLSSTTATARSSGPLSPPKKFYKGSHGTKGAFLPGNTPAWQRSGPTRGYNHPKAKSGKPRRQHHHGQNDDHPKHNVLLRRLSLPFPSPSPSPTLLERIGGSVEDEVLTDSGRIDGDRVSDRGDVWTDLAFSLTPRCDTPEPGEVERFLESVKFVIGAPPPPSPFSSSPGPVHTCLGNKPSLALETHNLPVDRLVKVEGPSCSMLYSPTQTTVNSLPSANLTLDRCQQSPLPGDTMPPPSTSTIEECRKHLVPVLLASVHARDPGRRLDSEQCRQLLSDDHCNNFFRQAKEMRRQLSSLVSQKTPVHQGWSGNGSLKRDRVDDVGPWVRNSRSRFSSVNTVVSDVLRRGSDITLVDFTEGKLPPKAPRAMLQASQAVLNKSLAQDEAPCESLVASPTTEDHPASATSWIELVQQAVTMFPTLTPAAQPAAENNISNVSVGTLTGDQSEHPGQVVSPTHAIQSSSTDFVLHLPTHPGIWFRQQGRQHAEIVDVDIDVSDEMFYMSRERWPFRLRMHLRLCSVPAGDVADSNNYVLPPASLQDVDAVIARQALHWPTKGKLVVQVNPESERSKTWLPYTLVSDPLDVTSCILPGKNTFRFIQLSDLSGFTFVLAASLPPPEEAWRNWDWASLELRSRSTESSTAADDPMNDLSEFARIPVTVRS